MPSLSVCLILLLLPHIILTLDNSRLLQQGIMSATEREIKVYTNSITGNLAVRLIPNLPQAVQTCSVQQIKSYNDTLNRIFTPIRVNLEKLLSGQELQENSPHSIREPRLVGAIIGTAALGLATAAQVTAALALNQAQDNARAILNLKDSIRKTNEAVLELKEATGQIAVALDKTQRFINDNILPTINNLTCEVAGAKIGVELSLYLTELSTVFGSQITNPALSTLSLQALMSLCGNDFNYLLNLMGAKHSDLGALYEANLINGRIIQYDQANQIMVIQVSVPSISSVSGLRLTELFTLSIETPAGEGKAVVPQFVVESGQLIEEIDTQACTMTDTTAYCTIVRTKPLPDLVVGCLKGEESKCQYTTGIGMLESRFGVFDGLIVANCKATICRCLKPEMIIPQNRGSPITVISQEICSRVLIDGVTLQVEAQVSGSYSRNITVGSSQIAPSGPLDISSELGKVNQSLSNVEDLIDQSNQILNRVNPELVNDTAIIVTIVLLVLLVLWCLALTISVLYVSKHAVRMVKTLPNPYVMQAKSPSGTTQF
uniref:Fusion glycoprotein F0 n=4 Tax=avian paramyxovirus 6 TaxID=2560316 RepID=A0A2P1FTN5_9MONO|nr:fusion protein [Avian metaavulavirus 6]AVM38602.1 fusion protein [Avian metaavulavirus 6]AVM38603.1 fusion protein [Avian metaavulavirus 6]AVM38604.1 fusion protein [Avian metaavulavirus 6]